MPLAYTYTLTNGTTANATHVQTNLDDAKTWVNNSLMPQTYVNVSSNVTLTDKAVHFVNTSSARSLTLPAVATTLCLVVKDITGSAASNNITITPASGTIDGSATYLIDWNYGAVTVVSDGTNYYVI